MSDTDLSALAPLAALTALQTLNCSGNLVSDLAPLAALTALQTLNCSGTQVSDLAPLAALTALQTLNCSGTRVSDLAPLAALTGLQYLACGFTQVSDLTPLAALTALQALDCRSTQVSELAPLAGLTALHHLCCGDTQVISLGPLARLIELQSLNCYRTRVSNLAPLVLLTTLQDLRCDLCPELRLLPAAVRDLPRLAHLSLCACRIPGLPMEVISQTPFENCLPAIRAHFADLEAGAAPASDVKLIVLGNGRVGKTQICRRLRGEPYDPDEPSTHGILVTSAALDIGEPDQIRLNIWDFGGQDLYHGTHALFLRTSAIFMTVWAPATEDAETHTHKGILFRNQHLPYWLAYIRHLATADSPVLVVQTRADRAQDQALALPFDPDADRPSAHCVTMPYSAMNNRGRAGLDEALRDAVAYLRERQGVAMIGKGRLHVQRALQALRDADADLDADQRQHRTIDRVLFQALCDRAGNVSSAEHLLAYLHNAGIVFYRQGLFQDRIVLDQGWALDAIYTVFNRDKCVKELRRLRGRFTRPLLELFAWGEHSEDEQRLFLDMMTQCGICFVHRRGPRDDPDATEYIAPDLLPERATMADELASVWDPSLPTVSEDIPFEMLHPGLVRGLICAIGGEAGTDAKYWFGGVAFYETQTRSHALIEQPMTDAWHGVIRVQTQGGDAARLHEQLCAWIDRRSGRDGLKAARSARRPMPAAEETPVPDSGDNPPGTVGPAPRTAYEYFVSYAWGDDPTPEGKAREAIVDRLCAAAEARVPPIRIVRDKTTLRTGDPIVPFMKRIGAGDRVFAILSEKYLRSPWCMFELTEAWKHSCGDEADFRRRVRVYALPDAKVMTTRDRIAHAVYWKTQHNEIEATIKEHGADVLGTHDFEAFKRMGEFYRSVPDILATLFTTVQPRTFEELERHGFAED